MYCPQQHHKLMPIFARILESAPRFQRVWWHWWCGLVVWCGIMVIARPPLVGMPRERGSSPDSMIFSMMRSFSTSTIFSTMISMGTSITFSTIFSTTTWSPSPAREGKNINSHLVEATIPRAHMLFGANFFLTPGPCTNVGTLQVFRRLRLLSAPLPSEFLRRAFGPTLNNCVLLHMCNSTIMHEFRTKTPKYQSNKITPSLALGYIPISIVINDTVWSLRHNMSIV